MRYAILLSLSLTLAALSGCAKKDAPAEAFFPSDDQRTPLTRTLDVQAANGAAADRTLYAVHFDGVALNGLGRAKLDAMISARAESPAFLVYVDAQPAVIADRQESVRGYLRGLGLEQVRIEPGCDPRSVHSIAGDLRRLDKTESDTSQAPAGQPAVPTEAMPMSPVAPK